MELVGFLLREIAAFVWSICLLYLDFAAILENGQLVSRLWERQKERIFMGKCVL